MRKFLYQLMIWIPMPLLAQTTWESLKVVKAPDEYKTSSILYRIGEYHATGAADVFEKVIQQKIVTREDRRINVEVVNGTDMSQTIDRSALIQLGLEISNSWRNRASCWIGINDILRVSSALPEHYVLLPVKTLSIRNEGPALVNSDQYVTLGADGSGIKIMVIDAGFSNLSAAVLNGFAPPIFFPIDWTGTGLESGGTHGTSCVETVYDHAPNAVYHIHRVDNATDLGNAVEFAVNADIDIISMSIGDFNTGWDDDSGPWCAAIEEATDGGILVFSAAGNYHEDHWQGDFDDDDADHWHEWNTSSEANTFEVEDDGVVNIYLQWDGGEGWDYYDLFLYDASNDDLLESSTSVFVFEELTWTNTTGSNIQVYIAVQHNSPLGTPEFEVFHDSDGASEFQYHSTYGSTASPENSTEPNCISVGAVDRDDYEAGTGADVIIHYSSHGPTNGGHQVPDIVAPTNTTTFTDDGSFGGTSCAAPNAAGAAAAFWSGHPYLSATGVRQILLKKSSLYNDWGESGTEYIYGYGGMELYDYHSPTRYIDKDAGNTEGDLDKPYFNMQQADINAPDNALVVFLGGVYNAVAGYIFARPLVYRSLIEDAEVK